MSNLTLHREESQSIALPKPEARTPIDIRPARLDDADFRFIDDLQKKHSKMVGFLHRGTIESNIQAGDVLIAESPPACLPDGKVIPGIRGTPLGYCIGKDRYFKREDVGIIYQLNITPRKQRSLIGALLVKAMFEKAAYGCKLFCCWCAQDLDANYFWESIGFVPLAFRTGSEKHARIHIFWQKRIREGDVGPGGTPYWFPSLTSGGAIREGRLVIPIPPGTHWSEAKPMILPGVDPFVKDGKKALPPGVGEQEKRPSKSQRNRVRKAKLTTEQKSASQRGGLWFAPPAPPASEATNGANGGAMDDEEKQTKKRSGGPSGGKSGGRMYHPKYVAAARDLCARYLEEVHAGRLLPEANSGGGGKYDVSRQLDGITGETPVPPPGSLPMRIEHVPQEIRLLDAA